MILFIVMYVSAHHLNYCCINGQYVVRLWRWRTHVRTRTELPQQLLWLGRAHMVADNRGQPTFRSAQIIYSKCCIYGDVCW